MSAVAEMEATRGAVDGPEPAMAAFDREAGRWFGGEPAWLRELRAAGIERYGRIGFPTNRHEEWRFTNMAPLRELGFRPAAGLREAPAGVVEAARIPGVEANVLVFVDGRFDADASRITDPGGLLVAPLGRAVAGGEPAVRSHLGSLADMDGHPFVALNTALWREGVLVVVRKNRKVADPVHLVFLSGADPGAAVAVRVLVVAEPGSEGSLVESYHSVGPDPGWVNAVTEVVVGDNARFEHTKLLFENEASIHTATVQSRLGRDAYFTSHSFALGARIARNDINSVLGGENSTSDLNGLYVCRGQQLCDHHTVVDHATPRCGSHEFYHGILDERAHGVFNGKIFVRPDAQKTDAKQTNRGLLLSDTAWIDTKPQLEIFADDVKCTHGATIGRLDKEALRYLNARGIGPAEAHRLLTHAFAGEIIQRVASARLREHVDRIVFEQLERLPALT